MQNKLLFAFALVLSVTACSRSSQPDDKGPIAPFGIEDENQILIQNDEVSGTGKLKFNTPLLGINSNEHYVIGFRLGSKEGSQLIVHSHFSGFQREDGSKLEFKFSDDSLAVRISTPNNMASKFYPLFEAKAGEDIRLRLEVHDGISANLRVIIWLDQISFQGEILHRPTRIHLGSHVFDSFEEGPLFLSHGRGLFWGLELKDAILIEARREAAYVD